MARPTNVTAAQREHAVRQRDGKVISPRGSGHTRREWRRSMTASEFKWALTKLGLNEVDAARLLGRSTKMVKDVAAGRNRAQESVARLLRLLIRFEITPDKAFRMVRPLGEVVRPMTAAEFAAARTKLGLSQSATAKLLGLHIVSVQYWESSAQPVNETAARFMRLLIATEIAPADATRVITVPLEMQVP